MFRRIKDVLSYIRQDPQYALRLPRTSRESDFYRGHHSRKFSKHTPTQEMSRTRVLSRVVIGALCTLATYLLLANRDTVSRHISRRQRQ